MRFQAGANKATYTLLPEDWEKDIHGRLLRKIPGIRAEFKGPDRIFDSSYAQQAFGWDDETRVRLERYLMSHGHFGRPRVMDGGGTHDRPMGNIVRYYLWFAPGEGIPEEHLDYVKDLQWYQIAEANGESWLHPEVSASEAEGAPLPTTCVFTKETADGEITRCGHKVRKGALYCPEHAEALEALDKAGV